MGGFASFSATFTASSPPPNATASVYQGPWAGVCWGRKDETNIRSEWGIRQYSSNCRIISATSEGPCEGCYLVNLSDTQPVGLNGETNQRPRVVGCCGSLVRALTLVSGQNTLVWWIHQLFLVLPIEDLQPMNASTTPFTAHPSWEADSHAFEAHKMFLILSVILIFFFFQAAYLSGSGLVCFIFYVYVFC